MSHSWEGSPKAWRAPFGPDQAAQGVLFSGHLLSSSCFPEKNSRSSWLAKLQAGCHPLLPAAFATLWCLGREETGVFVSTGPAMEEPSHSHESQESKSSLGWESQRALGEEGAALAPFLLHPASQGEGPTPGYGLGLARDAVLASGSLSFLGLDHEVDSEESLTSPDKCPWQCSASLAPLEEQVASRGFANGKSCWGGSSSHQVGERGPRFVRGVCALGCLPGCPRGCWGAFSKVPEWVAQHELLCFGGRARGPAWTARKALWELGGRSATQSSGWGAPGGETQLCPAEPSGRGNPKGHPGFSQGKVTRVSSPPQACEEGCCHLFPPFLKILRCPGRLQRSACSCAI